MSTLNHQNISVWLKNMLERSDRTAVSYKDKKLNMWIHLSNKDYLQRIVYYHLLLTQKKGLPAGAKVALMSQTRWEWAAFDIAAIAGRQIVVPLYPNLTDEDVVYILNHCEASFIVVDNEEKKQQVLRIQKQLNTTIEILVFDELDHLALAQDYQNINTEQIQNLISTAEKLTPEDPITVIYTSGTTGQPKGVLMQHQALVSEIYEAFGLFEIGPDDTSLSFLPYAHVMGRIEHWGGCSKGYRLAFAESIDSIKNNLIEIQPQFLVAVPRIFEKIYAGILNKVETSTIKKKMFFQALNVAQKMNYYRETKQTAPLSLIAQFEVLSRLVFSPIKKAFGGQLRFAISGGAPLGKELGEFFSFLGIKILEGYGLTETFAAITVNTETNWQIGTVGKPIGDVDIKFDTDGEILVKSKKNLKEYYKNPEATAAAFVDGYFRTGDIGEFTSEGYLKITDRKKDLIKTAGGKYVAPQKIEGLLKQEPLISQVLVIGDQKKYVSALISCEGNQEQKEDILNKIHSQIQKVNSVLASYESVKRYEVVFEAWTVDNGSLTPSMKVKRKVLEKKYFEIIEKIYSS